MEKRYNALLFRRHPVLLRDREGMPFGFEHANGWFVLVDQLMTDLESLLRERGVSEAFWPRVVQVKEKFGTLRFYVRDMFPLNSAEDDAEGDEITGLLGRLAMEKVGAMCSLRPVSEIPAIAERIRRAEEESADLCERCGSADGLLRRGGWVHTFCDACEDLYQAADTYPDRDWIYVPIPDAEALLRQNK